MTEQEFRRFDQHDDDPGPLWWQAVERHPLLVAVVLVGLGICPYFWRN